MEIVTHNPDAPFRNGVSGKYKLLIKSVVYGAGEYKYELSDADGKLYEATSKMHYPEKQLLRCIISFAIAHAQLIVSSVSICKKQDLAITFAEATKQKALVQRMASKLSSTNAGTHTKDVHITEGAPSSVGNDGVYRLRVVSMNDWKGDGHTRFDYTLSDSKGIEYHAISNQRYDNGSTVICRVDILRDGRKPTYFVTIAGDSSSRPVSKVDGAVILRQHYLYNPTRYKVSKTHNQLTKEQRKAAKKDANKQEVLPQSPKSQVISGLLYEKGSRYDFFVTSECDGYGCQILEDEKGTKHLLVGTDTRYEEGDKVRCTVKAFSTDPFDKRHFLTLSEPRIIQTLRIASSYSFINNPNRWRNKVDGLGKHKCGKPFTCSCCGKDFPAFSGWRVDLKEIYFCNACARAIYEPGRRGNKRFYILTPMGNKR